MLTYKTSKWQRILYEMECESQPAIRQSEISGKDRQPMYPLFNQELFARLYNPDTKKLDKPMEGSEWAERLHQCADEVQEFKLLQEQVRGDEYWAGAATALLSKDIQKSLINKKVPDIERYKNEIITLNELSDKGVSVDERLQKAMRRLAEAEKVASDAAAGIDVSQVRQVIRRSSEKLNSIIAETEAAVSTFRYGNRDAMLRGSSRVEEKSKIAERLKNSLKLKTIAEMAGKMRVIAAEKQRSKSNYARTEVESIEMGSDPERLLPSEWALQALNQDLFYQRLAERKCLQYSLRGKEREGRGPILICLDESGSMQTNSREIYSKAMAIALLSIAQRQKRTFGIIHFNKSVQRVDVFKPEEIDPAELLDAMDYFSDGGTDFEKPLNQAMNIIKSDGAFKGADIVFITDGCAKISHEFKDKFNEVKTQLEVTLITLIADKRTKLSELMREISDKVFDLDDCIAGTDEERRMQEITFKI